jgi:predicted lipid-binding transport protein (Tim44 family)
MSAGATCFHGDRHRFRTNMVSTKWRRPTARTRPPHSRPLSPNRRADPGFDPAQFLAGARVAFEMIVAAFTKGDKAALRPLLSDEVFRPFAQSIDERMAAKETDETRDLKLDDCEIVEGDMNGRTARVTVKLVSHQITVTRAMDGSIVDGDPDQPAEKTDFWTFARDTRSTDPNWMLVATNSG